MSHAPHDLMPAALDGAVETDPDRPLITVRDEATGGRTEVTAGVLAGWVRRTANLLVHGCGARVGWRVATLLPPHWQTAAVILGAWSAGMSVEVRLAVTAGLAPPGAEGRPIDVLFASRERLRSMIENIPDAPVRFALSLDHDSRWRVPDGYRDFAAEALGQTDLIAPRHVFNDPSGDGTTFRQWGQLAWELARRWDLFPGDRVLMDVHEYEHPVKWLLAPMAAGASVVLCSNLDRSKVPAIVDSEGITRVL